MKAFTMSMDGHVLRRGFWLYVWRISIRRQVYLYVGRTGDSSSGYAGTPFARIALHLGGRPNARASALGRKLSKKGIDPTRCKYEMRALGPIWPEQHRLRSHRMLRNKIAGLERALADRLKSRGYEVLGSHPRVGAYPRNIFNQVCRVIDGWLRRV